MLTTTFYKLLDGELNEILAKNPENKALHKHKDIKLNKGYAFMMWFLDFYGQKKTYQNYITDGSHDSSCDIIFSNKDIEGNNIFYIIQSKWVNVDFNKPHPNMNSQEFKATISDFTTVLNGTREQGENVKFNQKYKELLAHLEENGKAKFVFFTAADTNNEIEDTIKSFKKENGTSIDFLLIDINRIKRDYIEFKIKQLIANNPLEYNYSPEDKEITLEIERYKDEDAITQDIMHFQGRAQAYIFLLKPKTIHELFRKYKFNLFFKNVRNPLHQSNYNEKIVETLLRRPDSFWYFNNGITAITKLIPDGIGKHAKSFKIIGLQIINGAQTIYSIYKAYESATLIERKIMDTDARVSFRLIRSADEDFSVEITRYTNQQNPMEARDFVANLDDQERLQLASFKTNYWYEKRRGEFGNNEEVEKKYDIEIIPSDEFITAYLAFYLQKPTSAIANEDNFFLKRSEDKNGLYEEIFNVDTNFDDMLCSLLILYLQVDYLPKIMLENNNVQDMSIFVIALSKIVLEKYLGKKFPSNKKIDINIFIKKSITDKNIEIMIRKILRFADLLLAEDIDVASGDIMIIQQKSRNLMSNQLNYEILKQKVEETEISIEDIENIVLDNNQV